MMNFESPLDGYFTFLAWNIDLNTRGPFVRVSARRAEVEDRLGELATGLRREGAKTVHVLAVQLIVPISGGPKYDLALLVHAAEPMHEALISRTAELGLPAPALALTAVNRGRFGDTEGQDGEILLNHFSGDAHPDRAVGAWKTVSAWYSKKLRVDNSTLLQFTLTTPFLMMNYAVLPGKALPFLAGQLSRPTFYSYVRSLLHDVGIAPFPIIARRVRSAHQSQI